MTRMEALVVAKQEYLRRAAVRRQRRFAILRRILPATNIEIREAYPDTWPSVLCHHTRGDGFECRLLSRDLRAIGAVRVGLVWKLPGGPGC